MHRCQCSICIFTDNFFAQSFRNVCSVHQSKSMIAILKHKKAGRGKAFLRHAKNASKTNSG